MTFLDFIREEIKAAKVVSFDIFDTLLVRPYMQPLDLFAHIEKLTARQGFAEQRISAESVFYRVNGFAREANIDDAYDFLPDFSEIKEKELIAEYMCLAANSELKEVYDYARAIGKKIIIASDMYLPEKFISEVLGKNGFDGYDLLYISNSLSRRKDRGDSMYDKIIADLGVQPADILHIGDNRHSDFDQAKARGITAIYYPQVGRRFLGNDKKFAQFYTNRAGSVGASIITAMAAQKKPVGDYWVDFGYKYVGPAAFGYARFVYNGAIEAGLNKILFVMRDGYLIKKVFDIMNFAKIETDCVYAPRIMNYTTNLDYDPEMPEQPRSICSYFGKDTGDMSPKDFIIKNLAEFQRLAAAEKLKTGYSEYIKGIVGNHDTVGVVDSISRQLSGQKLIEIESHAKTIGFYWHTVGKHAALNQFAHNTFMENNWWTTVSDLIEPIFTAPEDPIIAMADGKPVYQKITNEEEKNRQRIYKKIEQGALEFAREAVNRFGKADLFFTGSDIFTLFDTYIKNRTEADIRALTEMQTSVYADNSEYVPIIQMIR